MDINFELYKIFYLTAKNQSFSEAANFLFITQSAVSQAIKNLETKLGVQLFFRKTRHFKLTPEGELLFTHIEQAYNFIKIAEQKVSETQNLDYGEIRIGASDTVCKYHLLPYLKQFNLLYPKIKIQFINRTSGQILEILKKGSLDFGVVTLPVSTKNFTVREFVNVEDIWVAAPKYNFLRDELISITELIKSPLLLLEKSSATRRNLDLFFQEQGVKVIPEIELESVDLLVEFARIGLGIAHVLRESAIESMARGELFEIKPKEQIPKRKLGIASIDNLPLSQAAERFLELIIHKKG